MFDDIIIDMEDKKKISPTKTELFEGAKHSKLCLFLYHSLAPKCLRTNRTCFVIKVPNNREHYKALQKL